MNHDYLARIAALEDALRQKDSQLSLVAETESFLRSALARAEEKIENEEREIEHLRAQIEKLRRMLFGTRSGKLRRQVEEAEALLKQQEQQSDPTDGKTIRRYLASCVSPAIVARYRHTFPARYIGWILRKPAVRNAAAAYLSEVSVEQLELVSSALKVIRTVRVKKACTRCDCIVEAPAPSRPIDRGIAGPGLLARVLTAKYCEHLPLYRQCEICPSGRGSEPGSALQLGGCLLPVNGPAG
jgi:transposase